jgi:hypothetical protein
VNLGVPDRSRANRPSLTTSRRLFALAVVVEVVGYAVILEHGWILTRIDWISLILAVGALAYSYRLPDSDRFVAEDVARRDELLSQFAVFVLFMAFYSITAGSDTSPFNAHVRQAVAFIHGHTYIDAPNYIEHAQMGPYSYQLHPPLPAILLMPFAAIWGLDTNQSYFAIVVGALDVALAWRLLGRFRLTFNARMWMTLFFGAGTIIWHETVDGSSWAVSMTVAVMVTLLALDETFDRGRPAVVGLYAGVAALARYDLALVWPAYLALLLFWRRHSIPELFWFIPGSLIMIFGYTAFNFARYHSIFDLGVASYLYTTPEAGKPLFALRYLPNNFFTLFFMAPRIDTNFPYIYPTFGGQSILTTSPAFLLAFKASWRRLDVALVAAAALLAAMPVLFYVGNGASQFGTRHFVHVFPFVLVLMALGNRRMDQMSRVLIVASVCLVAWGIWCIRFYGLPA